MTSPPEFWLLDTNVWVFGLRTDLDFAACRELLDEVGRFHPLVPLQVLTELNAVLSQTEMRDFYNLVNQNPGLVTLDWTVAARDRIKFYEAQGCRKGDALIAAHAEQFNAKFVVTENRYFLQTLTGLSFKLVTSREAVLSLR